jgi:hypothetical protein
MSKQRVRSSGVQQPPKDTFYIKFFAPVAPDSIAALMQVVDNKIRQGAKKLGLLIVVNP